MSVLIFVDDGFLWGINGVRFHTHGTLITCTSSKGEEWEDKRALVVEWNMCRDLQTQMQVI